MFCPICGLPSETTGIWCPKHVSVVFDSQGKVISYQDIKETPYYDNGVPIKWRKPQ